ncbi:hypothetical protein [Companilactobacillus ginsenosidimutans]|uniref:Uncharacterized protein n=1 Tax=Companilactobacillus ginsenosidimutans TaxID=1007676 RepID=A0A0H4QL01_9LACO|nr:hypothetical protein [Companilactobacillus ginsenosidimutans]AKP67781.1 hypothetical protein ABM34_09720 [Companilactobacillus ginsenosidimutans]
MSIFHFIIVLSCLLIISLNGRFGSNLRIAVGMWRFVISLPLAALSIYLIYTETPMLLPMTIVILLMLLTTNYLKYKL